MFTFLQFVNQLIYMFTWFNSKQRFLERKGDVVFSVTYFWVALWFRNARGLRNYAYTGSRETRKLRNCHNSAETGHFRLFVSGQRRKIAKCLTALSRNATTLLFTNRGTTHTTSVYQSAIQDIFIQLRNINRT